MIEIKSISKSFVESDKQENKVLDNISLSINDGDFISIIGPNGSGKSTLLNILCGLLQYETGEVFINKKKPEKAKIGYVFQNYRESLLPWLKNIDNIAFSLTNQYSSRNEKRKIVVNFIRELEIENLLPLNKYPYQSSGGQQQLVTILRELIYNPDLLLLDEPFASLDYERRMEQQQMLLRFWNHKKSTVLFISHEIDEAIFLSDKVVLFSKRPAHIEMIFDIDLPRPRTISLYKDKMFYSYKIEIMNRFLEVLKS